MFLRGWKNSIRLNPACYLYIFILIFLLSCGLPISPAQSKPVPEVAPINPEFLQFQEFSERGMVQTQQTPDGFGFGHFPSPLDLSHLRAQAVPEDLIPHGLPSAYDLRTQNRLTPVRNQGNCGSCWAFAAYSSLESNLLPSESDDLSENNLNNTHGFDWGPCTGGNADISMAYLARWSGPVNESDDPYNPSSGTSPPGLQPAKHIQEVLILPDRTGPLDNDGIKQAVMAYGAVDTSMYYSDSSYHSGNHAYRYSGTSSANHDVAIVGWDDNFPSSRFSAAPPGNGAFIIRNSWGSWWGEGGYFYASYYDAVIGQGNYIFNEGEPVSNYLRIYQYDPLGWTSGLGLGGNTGWFANVFNAVGNEQLRAVSFYSGSSNSTYEIYVYLNIGSSPTSGSLAGSKTGSLSIAGYHTVTLPSPIPLSSGVKFSVVVKLTTPGYTYPIPIEYPFSNYSSKATANAGESFISNNGTNWSDLTSYYINTSVCLKVFTASAAVVQKRLSDFNGDGKSDVLWQNTSGTIVIWLMNGAGVASTGIPGVITSDWQIRGAGDFDGDGKADILWQQPSSGTVAVWLMNGATISSVGAPGAISADWQIKGVGDFDGDGKADILWQSTTAGTVAVWKMNGAVIASVGIPGAITSGWQIKGVGDFDGDGKSDILWQQSSSGTVAVWLMNGSTISSVGVPGAVSTDWQIKGVGDFDGDGKSDILWQQTTSGTVAIWLMNGSGTSSVGIAGVVPTDWQIKGVGDFDGNGRADILWQETGTGTVAVWLLNGVTISSVGVPGAVGSDWQIMNK
jgi:C1A family cysteine protease